MRLTANWFELVEEPEEYSWSNCRKICTGLLEMDFENETAFTDLQKEIAIRNDIRFLAELILWGDRFDSSVVQLFHDMRIYDILQSWIVRDFISIEIKVQILQTLSIILQNINEHAFATFDYSSEVFKPISEYVQSSLDSDDLTPSFINLLRTILSRIDSETIQSVFCEETGDIPCLWIVVEYILHEDSLVRTTARSILINTLSRSLAEIRRFTTSHGQKLLCTISELFIRKILLDEELFYSRGVQLEMSRHIRTKHTDRRSAEGDDLMDICSFLDDLLDSSDETKVIAKHILDEVLCHIANTTDHNFRLICIRKVILAATHTTYLDSLSAFLCEFYENCVQNSRDRNASIEYFMMLLAVFKNASLVSFLKGVGKSHQDNEMKEMEESDKKFIDLGTLSHEVAVTILYVIQNPQIVGKESILLAQNALQLLLSEKSPCSKTFEAVLKTALFSTADMMEDLDVLSLLMHTNAHEAETDSQSELDTRTSEEIGDIPIEATQALAKWAASFAFYADRKSLPTDFTANITFERHIECTQFKMYLMFIALVDAREKRYGHRDLDEVFEAFGYRKAIPKTLRVIETSEFSSHCGMIGVRCQIAKRKIHPYAMFKRSPVEQKDWNMPEIFVSPEKRVPDGSLLYLFFGNEYVYLVEPSLESPGSGTIAFQLPAFYCSTIIYSSTDTDFVLETEAFDESRRVVSQLTLDFPCASTCKNVAESLFVYIRKVRAKARVQVSTFVKQMITNMRTD